MTFMMMRNVLPSLPEAVKILTDAGHEVYMETDAGLNAGFPDREYSENGAMVVGTSQQILQL